MFITIIISKVRRAIRSLRARRVRYSTLFAMLRLSITATKPFHLSVCLSQLLAGVNDDKCRKAA